MQFVQAMWVPGATVPKCECGADAVGWIQGWFSDCVYTPWDMVGFVMGISSILFWVIAQLPQFIRNIRCKSADALSPWFLFQWLSGDTLNLLGCILTGDQLATETFTACYFIFADCCIISQYVYYQIHNRDQVQLAADVQESDISANKQSSGCYWAISDGELDRSKFGMENQRRQPGAALVAESGEKSSRAAVGHHPQPHYQPVTFVTGRSGAVMIAHAWQGPHKPLSASDNASHSKQASEESETRRPGKPEGSSTTVHVEGAYQRPLELESGSSKRPVEQGEIMVFPNVQENVREPERSDPCTAPRRPVVGDARESRVPPRSSKEWRRNLRRIVEEYGLEYGPPLHPRLTIHHNWQRNARKRRPVKELEAYLQGTDAAGGKAAEPQAKMVDESRRREETGSEKCVYGRGLVGRRLGVVSGSTNGAGLPPRFQEVREIRSSLSLQSSLPASSTLHSETQFQSNETGRPGEAQSDCRPHLEAVHPVATDCMSISERDQAEAEKTLPDDTSCLSQDVDPSSDRSNGAKSRDTSHEAGPSSSRRRALACIAGLVICSSLLQAGGGLGANRRYDYGGENIKAGLLFGSEETVSQQLGRKLLDYKASKWLTVGTLSSPQILDWHRWQLWSQWLTLLLSKFSEGTTNLDRQWHREGGQGPIRRLLVMCGATAQVWWLRYVGLLLGWGSAGFYLGSRVAQLVRNNQRKSAEGLSLAMFFCAFMANLTYGLAILLRAGSWAELAGKAPWLLGSMGTLSLDISIFMQVCYLERCRTAGEKDASERTPLLRQVV